MNNEDDHRVELVPSQSVALSETGAKSLVRRGVQELLARAEAEEWYKRGLAVWDQQQYGEAVECFRRGLQLNANHVGVQFCLGRAYNDGHGVPRDYIQAAIWYRKAAELGNAKAAFR